MADENKNNSDDEKPDEKDGADPNQKDDKQDQRKDGDDPSDDEEDEDKGPPLYKRPLFWLIGGLVLIVVVVGGLLWWLHARQYQSTDDAFVDTHLVRLAAQESGLLTEVHVRDNAHVTPGQLLAVIEPTGPEAQRAQALAGIAQARAQQKQAEAQVLTARATRAQYAVQALAPAADAVRARRDYDRYLTLRHLDPSAAAPTQVDQARNQAESTAAQAAAARRQVQTADANILAARKQVEASRAQVDAAKAQLAQANVTLAHLRIAAPVAGQVVNRNVNLGSYVAPGQQLMAIVPDTMWVTANFKETQLKLMRRGQHVDIRVDAFPDVHFEGHVDSIQHGAGQAFQVLPPQNATGNYVKVVQRVPVRILFDRPDPRPYAIGPGMSVTPRVKVR